jgi:hypothetical protein
MSNIDDKIESQSNGDISSKDTRADSEKLGTLADQRDMQRMGKTPRLRVS